MKALSILAVAGIAAAAVAQPDWYNGDPDGVNAISAEFNTDIGDSFLFEDFDHNGGTIEGLFGNFLISTNVTGYMWEIRSGVSNGSGGTLHAAGDTDGDWSLTRSGWDSFGMISYNFCADIPDLTLPAGTYMMALSPIGDGQGRSFLQTTSGAGGIGSPNDNDLNWFHSDFSGVTYAENVMPGNDFSYGINGVCIPAPASVALLGLGGLSAVRRRRR